MSGVMLPIASRTLAAGWKGRRTIPTIAEVSTVAARQLRWAIAAYVVAVPAADIRVAIEVIVVVYVNVVSTPSATPSPTSAPKSAHHYSNSEREG